jgi:hypothetical protein
MKSAISSKYEIDKINGRNGFNFWCEDICGSLLEKVCQLSNLDMSEDFGAEFGNSCYMVYTSSAFVLDDISFLVFVCVSNSVVREIERLI